jgi:hypothetical protein
MLAISDATWGVIWFPCGSTWPELAKSSNTRLDIGAKTADMTAGFSWYEVSGSVAPRRERSREVARRSARLSSRSKPRRDFSPPPAPSLLRRSDALLARWRFIYPIGSAVKVEALFFPREHN